MRCFEFYAYPFVVVIIALYGSVWSLHIVSPTYWLVLKKINERDAGPSGRAVRGRLPAVIVG
jgi:hypothetical protein